MDTRPINHNALLWQMTHDGTIICDLCPRRCRIPAGEHGACLVRQNHNDTLILATYGRTTGLAVDPIEKKPLYHFYPGTTVLSFGTPGCNLTCHFCQNWHMSRATQIEGITHFASPRAIAKAAQTHHCKSVAFTYNEPLIFSEYAIDTAVECHQRGIQTVAVTAGYMTQAARELFFPHIDAANIDLKSFSDDFYKKWCGASLHPILETLAYVKNNTKTWLEVTTLLIPGENDSDEELTALVRWFAQTLGTQTPLHFSAFHPSYKFLDRTATPSSTLIRAREIAQTHRLKHVYLGNIETPGGGTTYCQHCGMVLIERCGFTITTNVLHDTNRCPSCNAPCAGHFTNE